MKLAESRNSTVLNICVLIIYGLIVSFIASHHEVWRDEAAAMSIAFESTSIADMLGNSKGTGHPILWFLFLYLAKLIYSGPVVLKILNISICLVGAYIFLTRASFSRFNKFIYLLGYFPLYLFPIINRNYGISMMCIFLVCALYANRHRHFIWYGLSIGLLANCFAGTFIIAVAFCLALLFELILDKSEIPEDYSKKQRWLGFVVIAVGLAVGLISALPDGSTRIYASPDITLLSGIKVIIKSLVMPGKVFSNLFGYHNVYFSNIILVGLMIFFVRNLRLLVILAASIVGLGIFHQIINPLSDRHQSILYVLIIGLLWIEGELKVKEGARFPILSQISHYIKERKEAFLTMLLLIQVAWAVPVVMNEIYKPYSSVKPMIEMVKKTPHLKDAIFMGRPRAFLEGIRYYSDNLIYMHREGRFQSYRVFTYEAKNPYTMSEFIEDASKLKKKYPDRPILIVIGGATREGETTINQSYGMKFYINQEEWVRFKEVTQKVASFDGAIGDENFDLYLLK